MLAHMDPSVFPPAPSTWTSGVSELDMHLLKNTIKTFPQLWLQDFTGRPIQSHVQFSWVWICMILLILVPWLAARPPPSLRKATSLLPEKRANRDPIETALTSSVKLLRINHTESTKHTSWAVPEEKATRQGRTGSIWLLCCFSYCKKQF